VGRKSKRLKLKTRIERLGAQVSRPSPVVENSVMQEKLKEEKIDVAPDTSFTPDIVEEMIKEVEEMVEEVKPKPKPKRKPRTTRARRPSKKNSVK